MSELSGWDSIYVIVGSAAGALIGLQFVVMTLIAERPPLRAAEAAPHLRRQRSFTSEPCWGPKPRYIEPGSLWENGYCESYMDPARVQG